MEKLLSDIRSCQICAPSLPLGTNPVLAAHKKSKIVIIGQAPGSKVHKSGVPWQDASGNLLRKWLNVSDETFYNPEKIALIPMGFCYPGSSKSGDLPPRKECAIEWHDLLFNSMKEIQLIILIGMYAQKYYLKNQAKNNLTETVRNYRTYLPKYLPLPHPSPRNRIWLMRNPWFEEEVIPFLQEKTASLLA